MDRFPKKIFLIGCAILGCTLAMGWGGLDMILRGTVKLQVRLINGTKSWDIWENGLVPLSATFYIFNITNPKEFANGEKANLVEIGPYVYKQEWHKVDMSVNITKDSIKYKQEKLYFFQPNSNGLSENDKFNVVNLPYIAIGKLGMKIGKEDFSYESFNEMMVSTGEGPTKELTMRELIFDGVSIKSYQKIIRDPMVQAAAKVKVPKSYNDGKYGYLKKKNGSASNYWEVRSGWNVTALFGQVIAYNEKKNLPYWSKSPCNSINGTDGTIFEPYLTKESTLQVFNPTICKSYRLEFTEEVTVSGVISYRFRPSPSNYFGAKLEPKNNCYCMNSDNEESLCYANGVIDLRNCREGAPIIASQPHFYGADGSFLANVNGLAPDSDKHDTFFDIHPLSGMVMNSGKRTQFNVQVDPLEKLASLAKMKKATVPVFWMEEKSEADDWNKLAFLVMQWSIQIWDKLRWIFCGLGWLLCLIGLVIACTRRSSYSTKVDRITLLE